VQALPQEGKEHSGAASPQSDSSRSSSSSSDNSADLAPSANPFTLLGSEDGGRGSSGSASSTGSDGGGEEQQAASGPSSSFDSRDQALLVGAACTTPKYRASVSGGERVLRLSVDLPGVQDEGQLDWQLAAAGGGRPQQLQLQAGQHALQLPLPVPVAAAHCATTWAASKQRLTVTWPLLP
jgi:hypothetical protein